MQACIEQRLETKVPVVLAVHAAARYRVFGEEEDDTSG